MKGSRQTRREATGSRPAGGRRSPRVLVVAEFINALGREMVHGLTTWCKQHGPWEFVYDRRLMHATSDLARRFAPLDGMVIQAYEPRPVRALARSSVPMVVVIQEHPDVEAVQVVPDLEAIGNMAADHLLGLGLEHLAFWSCGRHGRHYAQVWKSVLARRAEAAGASFDCFARDGRNWELSRTCRDWLSKLPKPVGLFARSDAEAQAMAVNCYEMGIRVPDEVAILGAENDPVVSELSHPPLSTIDQNMRTIGYKAARLLDRAMQGGKVKNETVYVAPASVVVRQSTQMLAVEDEGVAEAIRVIRERACEGIGVSEVAAEVAVPRRTLEAAFRRHLDTTIHERIVHTRIERLKHLLVTTDLDMTSLSLAAGFASRTRMAVSFKERTGSTPTAFRRSHRGL
jgi:LacI family transcriptional regulator